MYNIDSVSDTLLGALQILMHLILQQYYEVDTIETQKSYTWLAHGHPASGVHPDLEPQVADPRSISVLLASGKPWLSLPDVLGHTAEGPWESSRAVILKLYFLET